jgi:hypothetical protein
VIDEFVRLPTTSITDDFGGTCELAESENERCVK